jgi:hypothetical protein
VLDDLFGCTCELLCMVHSISSNLVLYYLLIRNLLVLSDHLCDWLSTVEALFSLKILKITFKDGVLNGKSCLGKALSGVVANWFKV